MYGAIFGDIIGSRFEFDRGGKTKKFRLFTDDCYFTDDTVMTVAVAEGIIEAGPEATVKEIKKEVVKSMRKWGKKYPHAGYGGRFYEWLKAKDPKPYGSYGNGSAMRVSAVGWLYDSLERTSEVARATAEVTHNHPEGVKGATCTAEVIYLARNGKYKEEIKEYVEKTYNYDLSETLDQLRKRHEHVETCQDSLPKALVSFFEGDSYEDVVRNAVSLGGDTDTLAAIAGAMAEAYYGITIGTLKEGGKYIPQDMLEVINVFTNIKENIPNKDDVYYNNRYIKMALSDALKNKTEDDFLVLLNVLVKRIQEEGVAPAPMVDVNNCYDKVDLDNLKVGDEFTIDEELRLKLDTMQDQDGKHWIPLFTDEDEVFKGDTTNILFETQIEFILNCALNNEDVEGLVINPFGQSFTLPKPLVEVILDHSKATNGN